ncbi:GyrI-like domain-containing protein [Bosea sp. 2RAB26]|uniref:GyrI-like domain-containing protein n=1 Tax=Bosea sp. 2RAB26 TaxID=3237476 RepID=UPI003F8E3D52
MMRHFRVGILAVAGVFAAGSLAIAQTRVAPPTPVEAAPLAPPPGAASPSPAPVQAVPVQAPAQAPADSLTPPPVPLPAPPVTPPPSAGQPVPSGPIPQGAAPPPPAPPPPPVPAPATPEAPPAPPLPAPPVAPQQRQSTVVPDPNATLAGKPGDPSDVDEVQLVPKPVLAISGQSSWDQGFQRLVESFRILREQASRSALSVAGRPLTLFIETDDSGFRFEAMLPVDRAPDGAVPLANGVRSSTSPAGLSLRFVHTAPYDDIDSTYETITAYLEAKNIKVKDAFLEEYVTDLKDPGDPNLEINVYVQPQ